ncbi:MAG: hypothetical protein Q8940_07200 [Bacteroidota bacterium]|nr:hypothetical protein [Bacteroidota bacterium]
MADVTTLKRSANPERLMGHQSTSLSGPVLFYEKGSFKIDNGVTSASLSTDLVQPQAILLTPKNTYGRVAQAGFYSDLVVSAGKITLNFTDPGNAAGGQFNYILIGTF